MKGRTGSALSGAGVMALAFIKYSSEFCCCCWAQRAFKDWPQNSFDSQGSQSPEPWHTQVALREWKLGRWLMKQGRMMGDSAKRSVERLGNQASVETCGATLHTDPAQAPLLRYVPLHRAGFCPCQACLSRRQPFAATCRALSDPTTCGSQNYGF